MDADDKTAAVEAAAEAALGVAGAIEHSEAMAEAAIEAAEERVEAAQAVAQQLADAVLQTEIGRLAADAKQEAATCLIRLETLETANAGAHDELRSMLESLRSEMVAMVSSLSASSVAPPSSSIPTPAPDNGLVPAAEVMPVPMAIPDAGSVVAPVAAAPARRQRRLI
jgi:hypothetical protein